MAKNNYVTRIADKIAEERHIAHQFAKQFTMDLVVITLGSMGMTPEGLHEFRDEFLKTNDEYNELCRQDLMADKTIEYSRDVLDRLIKQYVLPEDFVPAEERYDIY